METTSDQLDQRIAEWRTYLRRRQAIHAVDVDELEDHLRDQISALSEAGLADDEAFLVAVKRSVVEDKIAGIFREGKVEASRVLFVEEAAAP